MTAEELMAEDFGTLSDLVAAQGRDRPGHIALVDGERTISYGDLNVLVDRIAAGLQREGVGPREAVAICATTSLEYAAVFLGALRAVAGVEEEDHHVRPAQRRPSGEARLPALPCAADASRCGRRPR